MAPASLFASAQNCGLLRFHDAFGKQGILLRPRDCSLLQMVWTHDRDEVEANLRWMSKDEHPLCYRSMFFTITADGWRPSRPPSSSAPAPGNASREFYAAVCGLCRGWPLACGRRRLFGVAFVLRSLSAPWCILQHHKTKF